LEADKDRRQALAAMGGGLALAGGAAARAPAPALTVSVVLPGLYGPDGKLEVPPTLRKAGYGLRFAVVVANASDRDVYVWAEGNSEGHGTLSFEVTGPDGKRVVVRRVAREWGKNILRAEKVAPGGYHVRVVEYDPPAGKDAEWEGFPFGGADREVTLRAVFEQPKPERGGKLMPWAGRVVSPGYAVRLQSG
jgi:hypothetical protein